MNFTLEQKEKIQELLKIENNEERLISLKGYLATIQEQLKGDFAQIAYHIYLEHKSINKND
tara:strand:+ start:962 stop:1144 length:183 start_codon:yes stop_codon:yes gene_type:complete